jgi:uncharacterized transporter YbjL
VGLIVILIFAYALHLDAGTAAGVGAGSLTQTAMMGTASSALEQLGMSADVLKQQQANIAAGYAVTYILGYILVLLFVPFVAPLLMGINLKQEAAKLEVALLGGEPSKSSNLLYRKFQVRAYQVSSAAGRTASAIECQIGRRAVIERILRHGEDVELRPDAKLQAGDEILLAGPSAVIVAAASLIGPEIEGEHVMRSVPGEVGRRACNRARPARPDIERHCRSDRRHRPWRFPACLDTPGSGGAGDAGNADLCR